MLAELFGRRRFVYPAVAVMTASVLQPASTFAEPPSPVPIAHHRKALPPRPASESEASARLDALFALIGERAQALDRTRFDPVEMARKIGPRALDIFAFVRDSIGYDPYRGMLRFADGTLMTRAGNACDQSLLLAAMLRHHGLKVRFARAELSEGQARKLIEQRPAAPPDALRLPLAADLSAMFAKLGIDKVDFEKVRSAHDRSRLQFLDQIRAGREFDEREITAALAKAGLSLKSAPPAASAEAIDAARQHCWVQLDENGRWLDLDPAAKALKPGEQLVPPTWTGDALPAELMFKLRVLVIVEQLANDKTVKAETLLDHTAMFDRAVSLVSLTIMPENQARTGPVALGDNEMKAFSVAWPVLEIDSSAIAGAPFDIVSGTKLAQSPAQRSGPGGALDASKKGLDRIFGPKTPATQFSRLSLAVELVAPDGKVRSIKRDLARSAANQGADSAMTLRRQFLGQWTLAATAARIDETYFVARYFEELRGAEKFLREAAAQRYAGASSAAKLVAAIPSHRQRLDALAFHMMRSIVADRMTGDLGASARFFAAEPQLVAIRVGPGSDAAAANRIRMQFDVMANRLRVTGGDSRTAPAVIGARLGLIDTQLEYLLLGGGTVVNAHSVLRAAKDQSVPLIVATKSDQAALAQISIDESTRRLMADDLERGFTIVAPARNVTLAGRSAYAWYRINLETGEALGIGESGEGQSLTEYIVRGAALWGLAGMAACYFADNVNPNDNAFTRCAEVALAPLFTVLAVAVLIAAWDIILAIGAILYADSEFHVGQKIGDWFDN